MARSNSSTRLATLVSRSHSRNGWHRCGRSVHLPARTGTGLSAPRPRPQSGLRPVAGSHRRNDRIAATHAARGLQLSVVRVDSRSDERWAADAVGTRWDGRIAAGRGRVYLVRNHEVGDGPDAFAPNLAYDPEAGGGTTTMEFDTHRGLLLSSWASISGTVRNCAGGTTPWGSWLTCEETTLGVGNGDLTKSHGYIFEVPASGSTLTAGPAPTPFRAMGRFSHEALAIDPATGWVYETEDAGSNSGFYRFRPTTPGVLEDGGVLAMLGIAGVPSADTRTNQTYEWRDVVWYVMKSGPDGAKRRNWRVRSGASERRGRLRQAGRRVVWQRQHLLRRE